VQTRFSFDFPQDPLVDCPGSTGSEHSEANIPRENELMMLTVLVAHDSRETRRLLREHLRGRDTRVVTASPGESIAELIRLRHPDLAFVEFREGSATCRAAVEECRKAAWPIEIVALTREKERGDELAALRQGAAAFLSVPPEKERTRLLCERAKRVILLRREQAVLRRSCSIYLAATGGEMSFDLVVAESAAMRKALELGRAAAIEDTPLLLAGEIGTGRETLARAIHAHSSRGDAPFLVVDLAALHPSLHESELFGHEAGAIPGSLATKIGNIEAADGGTILLKGLSKGSAEVQKEIVRLMDEKSVSRQGGAGRIPADVRVMISVEGDPARESGRMGLRRDVWKRVKDSIIHLSPLRKRREDIEPLTAILMRRCGKPPRDLSSGALELLCSYSYPGNVAELANLIERAILLAGPSKLTVRHFPIRY